MLRHRFGRPVGCQQSKLAMLLSSNTRVAKATGGVQKHGECSAEWTKRSKVGWNRSVFEIHVLTIPTDLRALIRLQPHNAEAISELTALLPPNPLSAQPTKGAMAGGSSSSANGNYLDLPKPRLPKPLPFETMDEDRQKLKISNLPLTVDVPSNFEFVAAATATTGMGGKTPSSGRKGKPKRSGPRGGNGTSTEPDLKKSAGKGQTMSFTYPNWERYLVKKITD